MARYSPLPRLPKKRGCFGFFALGAAAGSRLSLRNAKHSELGQPLHGVTGRAGTGNNTKPTTTVGGLERDLLICVVTPLGEYQRPGNGAQQAGIDP
jgi:hypothetical protein